MFDEDALLEKLRRIEALHAGTTVDGERDAAKRAADRIRVRLAELRGREPDVEMYYRLGDTWSRRLFVALCRRYGLLPFRKAGRRYTTVHVRLPQSFHDKTLWPEFQALSAVLDEHLSQLTDRVIREAIHADVSEASEAPSPKALPESLAIGTTREAAPGPPVGS